MSEHTKEPWGFDKYGNVKVGGGYIPVTGFSLSAGALPEANSRRIVACVNALAGIDDPELWVAQMNYMDSDHTISLGFIQKLRQQRDELLSTMKAIKETLERENENFYGAISDTIWHTEHETLFDFMDAAIAKAEGIEDKPETYDCPIHGNLGEESCPRC